MQIRPFLQLTGRLGLIPFTLLFTLQTSYASGSGLWKLDPINGDWNTAANWSCECVPNGGLDTATFGASNITDISLSEQTALFSMVFNVGASAYHITCPPGLLFTIFRAPGSATIQVLLKILSHRLMNLATQERLS